MAYHRILTIQDISCVGQCSMTVALPILSACGLETAVLPSAVLSTHTGGFQQVHFQDLTDGMPEIVKCWKAEGIDFDAVYTGYLGSTKQIDIIKQLLSAVVKKDGAVIVDPAMADNGRLYRGFDQVYAQEMRMLCAAADYFLPNVTECCIMTGMDYREQYGMAYVKELLDRLVSELSGLENKPDRTTILTGVSYRSGRTGVVVYGKAGYTYYEHEKIGKGSHGTGDIFASVFTGALLAGRTPQEAAKTAADFVAECIRLTAADAEHWYGVHFEPLLGKLAADICVL